MANYCVALRLYNLYHFKANEYMQMLKWEGKMRIFFTNIINKINSIFFSKADIEIKCKNVYATPQNLDIKKAVDREIWRHWYRRFKVGDRVKTKFTKDQHGFKHPREITFDNAVVTDVSRYMLIFQWVEIEQNDMNIYIMSGLLDKID